MKCVNCGASYPDNKEQCPYCGSENTKRAAEEHKNKLAWYEIKSALLRWLPEMLGEWLGELAVKLLIGFVVIGILAALASAGMAKLKSAIAYENKDIVMEQLEILYQQESYEEMMVLLEQQEHYTSATYGRYYRIGELHRIYESAAEEIEESLQRTVTYGAAEDLRYKVRPFFKILVYCNLYEEDGFVYDEQEEVALFREKAIQILQESCFLNEDEIALGIQQYEAEEAMDEIYQLVFERCKIKMEDQNK